MRNTLRDTRAQPIRNLQANPVPTTSATWTGAGVAHAATFTTNSLGMKCFKITQSVTGSTAIYASRNNGGFGPIQSGEKYTFLCWVEADFTGLLQIVAGSGTGPQVFDTTRLEFAVQPNTPQLIRHKFTIPVTGATQSHFKIVAPSSNPSTAAYSVAKVMVVPGWYDGEYSDGDTPGWKWNGAVGTSTSMGWPYTLESIAGKPDMIHQTPGQTSYARPQGEPITLFAAYEIRQTVSSGGFLLLGRVGGNVVLERRGATPYTEGWVRVSNQQGSNLQRSTPGGALLGPHVIGLSYGLPNLITAVQDGTIYTTNYGSLYNTLSATSGYIEMPASDAVTGRTALYTWRRALSDAEMIGVSRWLANKYY